MVSTLRPAVEVPLCRRAVAAQTPKMVAPEGLEPPSEMAAYGGSRVLLRGNREAPIVQLGVFEGRQEGRR